MAAKYFYVKNGLGTRTTGGGLTKQTGSFTTLGAANVYNTLALALADSAPPVAGDFILFSSAHAYTQATSLAYTIPNGVFLESVDDANCDTYLTGASESTTATSNLTMTGDFYAKGLTFTAGSGTGATGLLFSNSSVSMQVLELCNLYIGTSSINSRIEVTSNAVTFPSRAIWKNVNVKFGNASQCVSPNNVDFSWHGGGVATGGTAISNALIGIPKSTTNRPCSSIDLRSLDLSNIATTCDIFDAAITSSRGEISNSETPASWTGTPTVGTLAKNQRFSMYNCDNGNTNYKIYIVDYCGTLVEETTDYFTSGASDGTTPISWKITTTANCSLANGGFVTPEIGILYSTTGSKTPGFEILTEGQLTTTDAALLLDYMGSASFPISTFVSTQADPLAGGTNLSAGAGTGSWNATTGLTSPTSSKLSTTQTVNQKGFASARIAVYKPSISTGFFVNPKPS